jgi:hypothetical protein
MLPTHEEFLSMLEVEEHIRRFEEKYQTTTIEFLRNSVLRATLEEDDVFLWEAFEAHREELVRVGEEVRGAYLSTVAKMREGVRSIPADEKQCLLAA